MQSPVLRALRTKDLLSTEQIRDKLLQDSSEQNDLDKLEKWPEINTLKFNKVQSVSLRKAISKLQI